MPRKLLSLIGWPDPAATAAQVVAFEIEDRRRQLGQGQASRPDHPVQSAFAAPSWRRSRRASTGTRYLAGAKLGGHDRFIVGQPDAFTAPRRDVRRGAARHAQGVDGVPRRRPGRALSVQALRRRPLRFPRQDACWARPAERARGSGRCSRLPAAIAAPIREAASAPSTGASASSTPRVTSRPRPSSASRRWSATSRPPSAHRLEQLDWMSPATRAEALKKLDTYTIKVGYPDKWRDYSNLVIRRDDLVGNVRRAAAADWQFYVGRSTGPVDKADWGMTPADQRRLQRLAARHRLPRRHPPGADLRRRRRPGLQLWRDRRRDRPRADPRLRRPGPLDRRFGRAARLVDARRTPPSSSGARRCSARNMRSSSRCRASTSSPS